MATIPVVAALICQEDSILACKCFKPAYKDFRWEFPGGKLEAGESPEQALRREVMEELGVCVEVGRVYDVVRHIYQDTGRDVLVMFYFAKIVSGEPQPLDGQEIRWVEMKTLHELQIAPADTRVVERLERDILDGILTIGR